LLKLELMNDDLVSAIYAYSYTYMQLSASGRSPDVVRIVRQDIGWAYNLTR